MKNMSNQLNKSSPPPRLAFKIKEAAEALGVAPVTVRRLIKRKVIKATKVLRHSLIAADELKRFVGYSTAHTSPVSTLPMAETKNFLNKTVPTIKGARLKELEAFRAKVVAFRAERASACSHHPWNEEESE